MGDIRLREVPEEIHGQVRQAAAAEYSARRAAGLTDPRERPSVERWVIEAIRQRLARDDHKR